MTLAAKQVINATQAALQARQQDSALAAATGYFELLKSKAVVEANRDALAASRDYEQQLQGGVDAGVIFKGDLLRVQTQTQRYQAAVIQAQQQQRLAAARLADLLHLDPAVELVPRDDDLVPIALVSEPSAPEQLVEQALEARPELQQSQAQLQAAREAGRNAVYGPLIPSVGVQAFFGELGGGPGSASGNFGHSRDYLVGLSWRLGPGGLFDFSRVRTAKSKVNSAELALEKVSSTIERQVVEARTRVQSSSEQMSASRQALGSAEETLRLTRERKQLGVGIVLEDIQAQQELVRARTEYLEAITSFNAAQYELSKALGAL
jgi:outer membrane protein TolC